jgi:hypothetical protein
MDRVGRVLQVDDRESLLSEDVAQQPPKLGVVVDDQDRLGSRGHTVPGASMRPF